MRSYSVRVSSSTKSSSGCPQCGQTRDAGRGTRDESYWPAREELVHRRTGEPRHAQRDRRRDRLLAGGDVLEGTPVANGCGPGWAPWQDGDSWRFANRHAYYEGGFGYCQRLPPSSPSSCDGEKWTYEVDFRDACNLHDAGYEGRFGGIVDGTWVEQRLVYDRILDVDVDFSTWSRAQVDEYFYQDMRALCTQQIVQQEGRPTLPNILQLLTPSSELSLASQVVSARTYG